MTSTTPHPSWTPVRGEIRAWLDGYAPPLAELYEGAVRLAHDQATPGWVALVSHAVREIRNRLPGKVAGVESSGRLDYKPRLDELAGLWLQGGLDLERASATLDAQEPPDSRVLPTAVYLAMRRLLVDHQAAGLKPRAASLRLIQSISGAGPKAIELTPVADQWFAVTEWFMHSTHVNSRTDADADLEELRLHFDLFESTLAAMARAFYDTMKDLDAVLEEANR